MKPVNFYEVTYSDGKESIWGGVWADDAIKWFRRCVDARIFVSVWDEEDFEEPKLITGKIEITSPVLSAILNEKERR